MAVDSVVIFRDVEAPIVFAGGDTTPNVCTRRVLQLNGDGITVSGQSLYSWTTRDGNLLSGVDTQMPFIDSTGRYQLNIIDPVNDCSGADIVRVFEDTLAPSLEVRALRGFALSCNLPELTLSQQGESGTGECYQLSMDRPSGSHAPGTNHDRGALWFPPPGITG